jgi:hypothetical protein
MLNMESGDLAIVLVNDASKRIEQELMKVIEVRSALVKSRACSE